MRTPKPENCAPPPAAEPAKPALPADAAAAAEAAGLAGFSAIVAAPGFFLGIGCSQDAVCRIRFLAPDILPAGLPLPAPASPLAGEAARQLAAWLQDPAFRFSLPARAEGSAFQQRTWAAIQRIPLGETRSYGQLALQLGSSPRAVGGACGKNPLPILVPCHRVVAAAGLGGFDGQKAGFWVGIKRWLLLHEQSAKQKSQA